jgi:hypothetical protein
LGWVIKICKETTLLIVFPNNFILSQFETIYGFQKKELNIQNKNVRLGLIGSDENAELRIYFLLDNVQKSETDCRFIYFTNSNLEVSNSEKLSFSILHNYMPSLVAAAQRLKKFDVFCPTSNPTKIDVAIRNDIYKTEKEEFNFVVSENEGVRYLGESSIVLFANNLFLIRFLNHLFDYAQFDLAEYDFNLNDFNKINFG